MEKTFDMTPFEKVNYFEESIASWFGSSYAVAVDCCTHGLELCLRLFNIRKIFVPRNTYLSVAMLSDKLNIRREFVDLKWKDYYSLTDGYSINSNANIIDAAVLWEPNSYITGSYMVLSFQFKKHLSLGRGGMILTDSIDSYKSLKAMTYDGRTNNNLPWSKQDIYNIGYHYYMTPETADLGLEKLEEAKSKTSKKWSYKDYPDLFNFQVFKNG